MTTSEHGTRHDENSTPPEPDIPVGAIDPSTIARIDHAEAMDIATRENSALADQLRSLSTEDWDRPTVCDRWNVRAVVAHLVGSAAAQASKREFYRQVRRGRPLVAEIGAENWWDGMNELQVRERTHHTTDDLINEWERQSARAVEARRKLPRLIARLPLLGLPEPVGRQPLSYLFDVGFTRDVWAHRIDVAVATDRPFIADRDHDGRILDDIVAEWATTHDDDFDLDVAGPAGGRYRRGDAPVQSLDLVDLVLVLAERTPGEGALSHTLPL